MGFWLGHLLWFQQLPYSSHRRDWTAEWQSSKPYFNKNLLILICSNSWCGSETQEGLIISCCRLIFISISFSPSNRRCGEGQGLWCTWGMDRGLKELQVSDFLGAETRMICTVSGCSGRGVMKDWRTKQSASTCTLPLLRINTGLRWPFGYSAAHVQHHIFKRGKVVKNAHKFITTRTNLNCPRNNKGFREWGGTWPSLSIAEICGWTLGYLLIQPVESVAYWTGKNISLMLYYSHLSEDG